MAPVPNKTRGVAPCADPAARLENAWPDVPTSILIIHGIGDQQPMTTLDGFVRGYIGDSLDRVTLEHRLVKGTPSPGGQPWFDNAVRVQLKDSDAPPIDFHEYYWAHHSRALVPTDEILDFIRSTAKSGKSYYRDLARNVSPTAKESGFSPWTYYWLLNLAFALCAVAGSAGGWLERMIGRIPLVGDFLAGILLRWFTGPTSAVRDATGDVVAYTASDPRSNYNATRQLVLGGAVDAILRLIAARRGDGRVVVLGHSLGSQIAVDAINRINLLASQGCVPGFDTQGLTIGLGSQRPIAEVLPLLVTFGSPVDKIAFFFRDVTGDDHPLRACLLENYHGFRQVTLSKSTFPTPITAHWQRHIFNSVRWVNYHCRKDLVSGALDYYQDVENVRFVDLPGPFPHGAYWKDPRFYGEIRRLAADPRVVLNQPPPKPPQAELALAMSVVATIVALSLAAGAAILWFGGRWLLAAIGWP